MEHGHGPRNGQCIEKIPNRFDLVLTATQRARGILSGDQSQVSRDNDRILLWPCVVLMDHLRRRGQ